jgi:hypothetical protein
MRASTLAKRMAKKETTEAVEPDIIPKRPTAPKMLWEEPEAVNTAASIDEAVVVAEVPKEVKVVEPVKTKASDLQKRIDFLEKSQPLPTWEGKDVRVMFPCMKTTNPVTAVCLIAMALDFGRDRIGFDFEFGDSMIYHARDKLADRFLKSNAQWGLFIDDDMILPIGRPDLLMQYSSLPQTYPRERLEQHVLNRLLSHGKTLVGATYFGRRVAGPPMFYEALTDAQSNRAARAAVNELRPTQWVGTGCMLIHRSVFMDIQKKFPELAPNSEYAHWSYFMPDKTGGEDVMFCKRATAAGHQSYVDLGLHCLHVGFASYGAHNTIDSLGSVNPLYT